MKRGRWGQGRARRVAGVAVLALALAQPGGPARAEDLSELDARIAELEQKREQIRLAAPFTAVILGGLLFQGGLSSIVSVQYNCPGYWDCSDETRWGLTAGAGAALVVGAITVGLAGPELSRRFRARRDLRFEIYELEQRREQAASRKSTPDWALGIDLMGGRRDLRVTIRY